MDKSFWQRTFYTIVLLGLIAAVIYAAPDWLFCSVTVIFIAVGLMEFFGLVERRDIFVYKYFGTLAGALIPVVIYVGTGLPGLRHMEPLLIVVASLMVFTLQFIRKDNAHDHLISTALTLFSLFYISWFFSFFIRIKLLENGANMVAFLILATKSADIFAYVIGKNFGRTELIPRISPNKTREGTFGGLSCGFLVTMGAGSVMTDIPLWHLAVLGIFLPVLGQIGDLAESLIKRNCRAKDSALYLHSMGGVLDIIDSLLFTVPIFYYYLMISHGQ